VRYNLDDPANGGQRADQDDDEIRDDLDYPDDSGDNAGGLVIRSDGLPRRRRRVRRGLTERQQRALSAVLVVVILAACASSVWYWAQNRRGAAVVVPATHNRSASNAAPAPEPQTARQRPVDEPTAPSRGLQGGGSLPNAGAFPRGASEPPHDTGSSEPNEGIN
jgi:hypothetical protein